MIEVKKLDERIQKLTEQSSNISVEARKKYEDLMENKRDTEQEMEN